MFLVNGQFPGPVLEIDQDDWVEITVVNKSPYNSSIHYHGIEQIRSPWADGVPGLTQRPIQPGASYTTKWHADQYGSYFYHAHSRGQIDDGCYGAIVIKPKAGLAKPFDKISSAEVELLAAAEAKVQPIIVSDWRHLTSFDSWDLQVASGLETGVCVDSVILNGKGAVDCWPREDIDANTSPIVKPLLAQGNWTITDKGCLPADMFVFLVGGNGETDTSVIPPSVFDVCSPTQGSRETITASPQDKWLALDIISTAGVDTFAFSIDEHPLWVYAVDGHYIEPTQVDALTVVNGDRFSIFVQLNKQAKNYGIRVASVALAQMIDTTAVLSYGGNVTSSNGTGPGIVHTTPSITRAGLPVTSDVRFFDPISMVAFPPEFPQPAPEADQTFITTLETIGNSYSWALNGTLFNHAIEDTKPPLLWDLDPSIEDLHGLGTNITIVTKNNTWVDLVFHVATLNQPPHPIHKHSNKGFIIGQGTGAFNWTSVAEAAAEVPGSFNLVNPPYRDAFATPVTTTEEAWLAVRYHVINPGPFMLHCHIQNHFNGGMAMVILDGVDEWPHVPDEFKN
ncbi:multicopper oxidase-domain-containing protein [Lophiotrema nucula]|uniref:Multicopper oxidase-domain-containing protein n=1 Tax=Lophiotrema nucula TaxID=690887 RepID=A0A6A5YWV8_9PLEO|nr:multicopper oxidase-domain-containing protein [Lophiotrema nucula]